MIVNRNAKGTREQMIKGFEIELIFITKNEFKGDLNLFSSFIYVVIILFMYYSVSKW